MTKDGYIKIYRSSTENKLYLSEPFTKWQAWCDLLFLAHFADSKMYVRGIKIDTKRGCVYKATEELAKRWKWSRGKVLRFLDVLETEQQIVQQKSNVICCISIVNYDKYQSDDTTNDTADSTATQKKEKKEPKKIKEKREENITPYNSPPKDSKIFVKPTVDEVRAYCLVKGYNIDAEYFINYYETNGWVQGRDRKPIKNWKACIGTWVKKDKHHATTQTHQRSRDGHPTDEQVVADMLNNIATLNKSGSGEEEIPF